MGKVWTRRAVGIVASGVGQVLHIEQKLHDPTSLGEARVLVDLSADEPPPDTVWMNISGREPIPVEIEYEHLPPRCDDCKAFGHDCSLASQEEGGDGFQKISKKTKGKKVGVWKPKKSMQVTPPDIPPTSGGSKDRPPDPCHDSSKAR